jgi:hypothetical protein
MNPKKHNEIGIKSIQVFQLNDEKEEFEQLELEEGVKLYEMLNPKLILYFISPETYRSFMWVGSEVSTRMKFIARNKTCSLRDRIGRAIKLISVDQNAEPPLFKFMVGIEKRPPNFIEKPNVCSL